MDFPQLVRSRRMVRRYSAAPVDPHLLEELVDLARRAPSAGFSQGQEFLVLSNPESTQRFWEASSDTSAQLSTWLQGMRTAPALILCLTDPRRYSARYAEADKTRRSADLTTWEVPFWDTDAAMSAMVLLLGITNMGLGACFFGLPDGASDRVQAAFDVPAHLRIVGVVSVGHPAEGGSQGSGRRERRSLEEVLHWDRYATDHSPAHFIRR